MRTAAFLALLLAACTSEHPLPGGPVDATVVADLQSPPDLTPSTVDFAPAFPDLSPPGPDLAANACTGNGGSCVPLGALCLNGYHSSGGAPGAACGAGNKCCMPDCGNHKTADTCAVDPECSWELCWADFACLPKGAVC